MLKDGKVVDKFCFTLAGTTSHELGELFDSSLKDTTAIHNSIKDLEAWLTKVDKSGWPGCFKALIYQHAILPRVL